LGWSIVDIVRISMEVRTHKIQLTEGCKPAIRHQRSLNPLMQEVVKKEIIKLLRLMDNFCYIEDCQWVSLAQYVPKEGGMMVVPNEKDDLVPLCS